MDRPPPPPYDAEKASAHQIRSNYRHPPGVPHHFGRNTLVVGRWGVGKTFLLRHYRHDPGRVALYGDLYKVLSAIASDTGAGALTYAADDEVARLVLNKTNALLAHWIADRCQAGSVRFHWDAFQHVLPPSVRVSEDSVDRGESLLAIYSRLFGAPLERFDFDASAHALDAFIESVAGQVDEPLVLLLDRLELAPALCVPGVFRLLDQTAGHLTIVASRPGILGHALDRWPERPTPGDHFDIVHLGSRPYGAAWRGFVTDCLREWIPDITPRLTEEHLAWILTMARDSVRASLELVYNSLDDHLDVDVSATQQALADAQQMAIEAAAGQLASVHPDVPHLLAELRKKSRREAPVLLIVREPNLRLLPERSEVDRLIDRGLRAGLFAMPHGQVWHPFNSPRAVEVPPMYLWRREDPLWSITAK